MSPPLQTSDCADERILRMFADGGLDAESRRRVLEHIATCAACRETVLSGLDSPVAKEQHRSRVPRRLPLVLLATLAGSAALLALFGPGDRGAHSRTRAEISALTEAANSLPYRLVEGRLSGGFAYKPHEVVFRGAAEANADIAELRLAATTSKIAAGAEAHAAGLASLLRREHDRAIALLEHAVVARRDDPLLLSDLSAALHARAVARDYASDHLAALDAAERAWRSLKAPEPAWNRAVAVAALNVTGPAQRAWDEVLRIESDPSWRLEAERRRQTLHTPTEADEWKKIESRLSDAASEDAIRRFPAHALAFFHDDLLPRWAHARLRRDREAASGAVRLARAVAESLAADDEHMAIDTVAAIDAACTRAASCDAMARAHVRYAEGVALLEPQEIGRAASAFDDAIAELERLASPYAFLARFRRSACLVQGNEFAEARRTATLLLRDLDGRRYRTLHARVLWLLGLTELHGGRPEESIAYYRAARARFVEARDVANIGAIELLLANAFEYAGERDVAMQHRIAAFDSMRRAGNARQVDVALFDAAIGAAARGWPWAADFLFAESTREAVSRRRFVVAALASMRRSELAMQRDDVTGAIALARMASVYTDHTPDAGQRELLAASANQVATVPDNAALDSVTETIRFFERAGNRAWLPQLLRQRALLHERAGDLRAAEADFRRAVDAAEEIVNRTTLGAIRDGYATEARAIYEDTIRLLLARGASREALAYAERARLIGNGPQADRDVLARAAALPPSTVAAVFEVQHDGLAVWLVARESITLFRSRRGDPLVAATDIGNRDLQDAAVRASLYDLLVRDWISHVPRETHLVLLPPPVLASVPFGALIDGQNGRAVIDDYAVSLARSLNAIHDRPVTASRSDRALVVGDPSYRTLPRLPASRREAIAVARLYARSMMLAGDDATEANVLSQMSDASILHFGGHAVVNDLAPELSSLMLAPDGDDADTRIYVHELLRRRLPLKIVVLAACSTAKSRSNGKRGTLTIARAFLDGGAEAVVGTAWPVSDSAAAEFSMSFHEELTRGEGVADAARRAQLRLRSSRPEDPTWAAFCVFQGRTDETREKPDA